MTLEMMLCHGILKEPRRRNTSPKIESLMCHNKNHANEFRVGNRENTLEWRPPSQFFALPLQCHRD